MLVDQDSNASGRQLANSLVDVRAQYGATVVNPASDRVMLTFGHPDIVHKPPKGWVGAEPGHGQAEQEGEHGRGYHGEKAWG